MDAKALEFLKALADLCEKYNATFSYTTDDDGVHIKVDDQDVFIGQLLFPNAWENIRKAIGKHL